MFEGGFGVGLENFDFFRYGFGGSGFVDEFVVFYSDSELIFL